MSFFAECISFYDKYRLCWIDFPALSLFLIENINTFNINNYIFYSCGNVRKVM